MGAPPIHAAARAKHVADSRRMHAQMGYAEFSRRNAGKNPGCSLKEQSHNQAAGSDRVPKGGFSKAGER